LFNKGEDCIMTTDLNATSSIKKSDQLAGYLLFAGALISVIFMLLHPSVTAPSRELAMSELLAESTGSRIVHGTLLTVLTIILFAVERFALRLRANGIESGLGLIFYRLGYFSFIIATMISGFIVPDLGAHYATKVASEQLVFFDLARLAGTTNQVFSKLASIANGLAALLWGVSMLRGKGEVKLIGAASALLGLAIAGSILWGLKLNVHGMTVIVIGLSLWQGMMGRLLIKADWS
jgi:hypothetical protein